MTLVVDEKALSINVDGILSVDGIKVFRKIEREGKIFIQVKDYDRMRTKCRGTYFVEVELEVLLSKLQLKKNE